MALKWLIKDDYHAKQISLLTFHVCHMAMGLGNHICFSACYSYNHLHYSITYEANTYFPAVSRAIMTKDKTVNTVASARIYNSRLSISISIL